MEHGLLAAWAWPLAGILLCAWWPGAVWGGVRRVAVVWASLPALLAAGGLAAGWFNEAVLVPPTGYGVEGWGDGRWRLTVEGWPLGGVVWVLTVLPFYLVAAWEGKEFRGRGGCLMGLAGAVVGAYCSQSLWGWLFWQHAALLCLWGLTGAWGREEALRQVSAARLLTWGLVGLTALSVALLLTASAGGTDLGFDDLAGIELETGQQHGVLAALCLALAAYVPLFPLHAWLPAIGTRAPLAAAAAVGLWGPMGLCGFLRLAPVLCADALVVWRPWLEATAMLSMLAGGLLAWAQRDVLRRQAYAVMVFYGGILWGIGALPLSWEGVLGLGLHVGLAGAAVFLVSGALADGRRLERVKVGCGAPLGLCWLAVVLVYCGLPGAGFYSALRSLFRVADGGEGLAVFFASWVLSCVALLRPLVKGDGPGGALRHWVPALGLALGALGLALYPAALAEYAAGSPWPPVAAEVAGENE